LSQINVSLYSQLLVGICILLLAALRLDDNGFLRRHSWITRFFPRKTAGILALILLFLSVVSGFAGLYVGVEVFPSGKTSLDANKL